MSRRKRWVIVIMAGLLSMAKLKSPVLARKSPHSVGVGS
jgi:hypothetical protein